MRAHAEHGANPTAAFLVKIARGEGDGAREHLWISVETATGAGGRGHLSIAGEPPVRIDFALGDIGDWRIVGLRADLPEVGPESVGLLT